MDVYVSLSSVQLPSLAPPFCLLLSLEFSSFAFGLFISHSAASASAAAASELVLTFQFYVLLMLFVAHLLARGGDEGERGLR